MNKKQQIKEWTETIDRVVESYRKLNEVCKQCIEVGAMYTDGKLWSAIWDSFDTMLNCIDDKNEWLSWYIYENNCGKNKYEAKAANQKKAKIISRSEDLAKLIVSDID
jgi:myo-inositol-hexaphosphate 3-phosphohydrolase